MNASNAFRSHLMQQFALTARGQSRPPLAMMPWMKDDGDNKNNNKESKKKKRPTRTARTAAGEDARAFEFPGSAASTLNHHHSTSTSRSLSSAAWSLSTATSAASVVTSGPGSTTTNSPLTKIPPSSQRGTQSGASAAFSSAALLSLTEDDHDEQKHADHEHHDLPTGLVAEEPFSQDSYHARTAEEQRLASQFQTLIHTRRTTSHFAPPLSPSSKQSQRQDASVLASEVFWKGALDRAVACGRRAPNHKRRTEAYSFKRMVSPSGATERLAEICYHVTLQKTNSEIHAKKKQLKWRNIPAFLVAILGSDQDEDHNNNADSIPEQDHGNDMYEPLPFVPIQTEGEMEDYACTCAAVQNVLLSLHSENIASKWATGPVVHTRAFRELVR